MLCKNDLRKKYSGNEKTPMGFGYASCGEKAGTIMKGTDDCLYIVKETKAGHRWNKIEDFDNLPSKYYRKVYYPMYLTEQKEETGLESKFGGKIPFFIEGEEWPLNKNGKPLTFIGQFIDPSNDNNILYRFFLSLKYEDEIEYDYKTNQCKVMTIKFDEENKNKQIKIEQPDSNNEEILLEPYFIEKWDEKKELIQYNFLLDSLKYKPSSKGDEILNMKYIESLYAPSEGIKFKGTSQFCQYVSDKKLFENFFQFSECDELPIKLGDCGIIHFVPKIDNHNEYYIHYDC